MSYKSTSDSYFNYFKGDPVGQNIYLLPNSNFEDGLGVFYSSSSSSFLVKVWNMEVKLYKKFVARRRIELLLPG